jgi:hypothetical protein
MAATTHSLFPLPLTRTAEFFLEVLGDVEAITVSEAWCTRMYKPSTATPTYELASEGANDVGKTILNFLLQLRRRNLW